MNVARVVLLPVLNPASNIVEIETEGWMSAGSSLTVREGRAVKAKDGDLIFGRLLNDVLPPGCLSVYEETEIKKKRR